MPQKIWTVGEEVLAADFQTYVQNQVTPTFANKAALDAGWVAPPDGAHAWTTADGVEWRRTAGVWDPYQQRGIATITFPGGGTLSNGHTVTFPVPFRVAPIVVAMSTNITGNTVPAVGIDVVLPASVGLHLRLTSGSAFAGSLATHWIAMASA